mmetsp:Transcript_24829/g.41484  ORF Transcript_24829/g.41484 Transcript_24829/m.41484 type:complete len:286 (-) Transcript_24829:126-983(-)
MLFSAPSSAGRAHNLCTFATASSKFSSSYDRRMPLSISFSSRRSAVEVGRWPSWHARHLSATCIRSTPQGTCLYSLASKEAKSKLSENAFSSSQGSCKRRSSTLESGLDSIMQCSSKERRTYPMRPYVRAINSGMPFCRSRLSSLRWMFSQSWVAMTRVKLSKKLGLDSIRYSGLSSTKDPETASLSSLRCAHTHLALGVPRLSRSTMKLFPRSRAVTGVASTTVKAAMPPRTRFLRVSAPVGPQFSKHTLEFSSAVCPCSPHIRICLSYFLDLSSFIEVELIFR